MLRINIERKFENFTSLLITIQCETDEDADCRILE